MHHPFPFQYVCCNHRTFRPRKNFELWLAFANFRPLKDFVQRGRWNRRGNFCGISFSNACLGSWSDRTWIATVLVSHSPNASLLRMRGCSSLRCVLINHQFRNILQSSLPANDFHMNLNGFKGSQKVSPILACTVWKISIYTYTCQEEIIWMSVNTKMEHRTLAWVLVITGTRVHLSESVSRKDSERKML